MRALLLLLVAVPFLSGCYYAQAVRGHLELMSKRVPVERLLERDEAPELRAELELALEIREFASRELGLPDNESYRSFADLGRDYATWIVVAAGEFSVEPETWCFPFTGCLAYRGYFSEEGARRFADRLAARGMDVHVSGAVAYSTLGHFPDPLLNTMLSRGEAYLAGTIFHELAHQQLFVRGDSAFNEAFAVVVEVEGVRRWFEAHGDEAALADYEARLVSRRGYSASLARAREELEALYGEDIPEDTMRARKEEVFDQLRAEHPFLRDLELNNAYLALAATYEGLVPPLERLLEGLDGDLERFYEEAARLAGLSREARRDQLEM